MNLTAILADAYRRLRYTAAPPGATVARLTAFVNETHRECLSLPGMAKLRDDVMPVTAYANLSRTGLPFTVARVNAIVDRTNNHKLWEVPLAELRNDDPAQAFTGGYPLRYAVIGDQAVIRQPSTTGLWVASSSASDTTQHAFVESIVTGGYPNLEGGTGTAINGTARVQVGTRTDHIEVTKFYVDAVGVGFISLYDASVNGNELARLPIGQTFSRCLALEWWPIQTIDVTEYIDYTRRIFDLVNGTDAPILPTDFHDLLALGVRAKEYEYLDDSRVGLARADYAKRQAQLKAWVLDDGNRIASLRPTVTRWSSMGPMFPAGS